MARKLIEPKVALATRNAGKLRELRHLLSGCGIQVASACELGLKEVAETERTFVGNARLKALDAAESTGLPAIADDSGLEVDALGGEPGVATADWAAASDGRNYRLAMEKVWEALEAINAPEPRKARFCSTICVAWPDGHCEFFEGYACGRIVWPMRGELGFGFDPIFVPDGFAQTFGEMEPARKSRISHRARSIEKFKNGCLSA